MSFVKCFTIGVALPKSAILITKSASAAVAEVVANAAAATLALNPGTVIESAEIFLFGDVGDVVVRSGRALSISCNDGPESCSEPK